MASKADICRQALSMLGISKTLANIEKPSDPIEISCDRWYEFCKEDLLSSFNWTFAKERFIAPLNPEAPLFDYTKSFVLPNDFLQIESIYDGDFVFKEQLDYRIEGRNILIDVETDILNLVYIKNLTQTGLFPAYFVGVLSLYLSLKMSNEINKNDTDIQRLKQLYDEALVHAKAQDSLKRKVYLDKGHSVFKIGTKVRRYGKDSTRI